MQTLRPENPTERKLGYAMWFPDLDDAGPSRTSVLATGLSGVRKNNDTALPDQPQPVDGWHPQATRGGEVPSDQAQTDAPSRGAQFGG